MPTLQIDSGLEMFYQVDNFTDPWTKPKTVLLLHGNSESGDAWFAWVPELARDFRVVRPDMRGFGRSTPMARDFKWSLDVLSDDFIRLMDELKIERFHVVGAKIGGTIARGFAARYPDRILSLSVVGSPAALRPQAETKVAAMTELFEKHGIEHWARTTMDKRLGTRFPQEAKDWWTKFMARTSLSSQLGFIPAIGYADIRADIPKIRCPTFVITTEESDVASVEQTREWQSAIPGSELMVVKNDSYHPAISAARECVPAVRAFLHKHSERAQPLS